MKRFTIFIFFSISILVSSNLNAQVDTSKIYRTVDEMPVLPNCHGLSNNEEQRSCTDAELMKYVKQNIHYPDTTGNHIISDLAIVEFVVSKDGHIINIKIILMIVIFIWSRCRQV